MVLTGLAALFVLTGCSSSGRSVERLPVPANPGRPQANNNGSLDLPTPEPASDTLPTQTATPVATYAATGTRTPTPTWIPTNTPTATSAPVATSVPQPAAAVENPEPAIINHVVIISIDGLRPDALDLADTPVLDSLRARGAYSPRAQAVIPSVTLINHASMLGGMVPAKHGVNWNLDEAGQGKINGPTVFSVAHNAGLSTIMVVGKPKFDDLVLPDSVDTYIYAGFTDIQVKNEAIPLIQAELPALLFIHLPDVDSAGHLTGWMSAGQLLSLRLTDGYVGEIAAALENGGYMENTLLIITSDHGGAGTTHGSAAPEEVTIPWLAVGPGVPAGVTLNTNIITYDTAATVLHALNISIPPEWDGKPVLEIFPQ